MLKGIEKSCRNITADKFESVGRIREAEANTFRNHTKKSQKIRRPSQPKIGWSTSHYFYFKN